MALILGRKMLKVHLKKFAAIALAVIQLWLKCTCISKSFYQHCIVLKEQIVLTSIWEEIKQSWCSSYSFSVSFLSKHHSSNRKFAPLDTQFLVNPEKSWHFRDIHLGQTFCSYFAQTTPATGIPMAHYKILRNKSITPSPFAYATAPHPPLHECLLSRPWLLGEYHQAQT